MHIADEHLLISTADGDHESFAALYDRYSPRVYGLIVKLMGRKPDAEDVLQEVFAEIWRRAGIYNSALGSAETWILMIARSRTIDRLRKLRREHRHLATITSILPRDVRSETQAHAADLHWLAPAVEQLTPELRDVVHMAYSQGLTREEIAAALGIPVGTVKTRLRTAVSVLAGTPPKWPRKEARSMTNIPPSSPIPGGPSAGRPRWQFDAAELADLFALGTLDAAEELEFDQRLAASDPALLQELARVRAITHTLTQSLAQTDLPLQPPAHLRDRIIAAAIASPRPNPGSLPNVHNAVDAEANLRINAAAEDALDRELRDEFARAPHNAHPNAGTASTTPTPPSLGIFVQRITEGRWRPTGLPGVWAKPLYKDRRADRSTLLVKCDPGAYIPHHDHQGIEELIVLEGDLKVGDTLLKAGDYIRTTFGQDHGDAFSPSGCICLFFTSHGVLSARSQLSMFTSAMGRWFARLLGR